MVRVMRCSKCNEPSVTMRESGGGNDQDWARAHLGLPVICGKCLTPSEAEQYVREPPDKQGLAQAVWALFMCIDCDPCALAAAMYGPDFVGWACV